MEMDKLTSRGTSAMVMAHAAYRSGALFILHIVLRIAVFTDSLSFHGQDIAAGDPFIAYITATGMVEIGTATGGTDQVFLIGWRIKPMLLNSDLALLKECTALYAQHHSLSPSCTSIY